MMYINNRAEHALKARTLPHKLTNTSVVHHHAVLAQKTIRYFLGGRGGCFLDAVYHCQKKVCASVYWLLPCSILVVTIYLVTEDMGTQQLHVQ